MQCRHGIDNQQSTTSPNVLHMAFELFYGKHSKYGTPSFSLLVFSPSSLIGSADLSKESRNTLRTELFNPLPS